jgi:hypothetical protein
VDASSDTDAASELHQDGGAAGGDASSGLDATSGDHDAQALDAEEPHPVDIVADLGKLSWTALDWAPEDCHARIARDVSSLPALAWAPAQGAAAACEIARRGTPHVAGGYESRHSPIADDDQAVVVYAPDGTPRYAIRSARLCGVTMMIAGSETCHGLTTQVGLSSTYDTRIKCGDPLGASPVYATAKALASIGTSPDTIVLASFPDMSTVSFRRADKPALPITLAPGGDIWGLAAHGSTAVSWIFKVESNKFAGKLVRSENGAAWAMLRDPAPKHVASLNATDTQLAWLETDEQTVSKYLSAQLWVAPWPSSGAALQPRSVGTVTNLYYDDRLALSDRYFAHARTEAVHLYRLSDGSHYVVPVPEQVQRFTGSENKTWLDDSYVSYAALGREDSEWALVRCRLAELAK